MPSLNIQQINRTNVYQLLRRESGLTKRDIVHSLRLSLITVTQNINDLMREGLVREDGVVGHTGGRKAKTYSIVENARIAIGLDITADYIIAAAVDLTGRIIDRNQVFCKFERSDDYFRRLGAIAKYLTFRNGLTEDRFLGVGIGVPGLVTEDNQTVFYGEILKFTGATCKEFSKYIPHKTALFNDASAAGFGEFWVQKKKGSAFYIGLNNNIGGAVMINGEIHTGKHFHSAEIGHLTLHPNGKHCYCGQNGCVDTYLAATILSQVSNGDLAEFFSRLEKKDSAAEKIWNTYLNDLALTVNNLQALFDSTVILGGYVAEYLEPYLSELKSRAAALNPFERDADYITICAYKTLSISAGAALHFISDFIDSI
jgi:predicted NBD/HSP70 family sugar kinase